MLHQTVASNRVPYVPVRCHVTGDTSLSHTRMVGRQTTAEAAHEAVLKATIEEVKLRAMSEDSVKRDIPNNFVKETAPKDSVKDNLPR